MATIYIYESIQSLAWGESNFVIEKVTKMQPSVAGGFAIETDECEYTLPANTIMKITGRDEE